MKTIEVYRFDELPEDVQRKVHENFGYMENPWADDDWDTWKKFIKDVFPNVIKDWSYGYRDTWITCYDNEWSDTHGEELRDYLSETLERLGENPTGYCADYSCYGYVRKNLDKIVERDMTAKDIAEDAFWHFCKKMDEEEAYCQSFEYFKDHAEANDWHYTKSGKRVNI